MPGISLCVDAYLWLAPGSSRSIRNLCHARWAPGTSSRPLREQTTEKEVGRSLAICLGETLASRAPCRLAWAQAWWLSLTPAPSRPTAGRELTTLKAEVFVLDENCLGLTGWEARARVLTVSWATARLGSLPWDLQTQRSPCCCWTPQPGWQHMTCLTPPALLHIYQQLYPLPQAPST